MEPSSDSYAKLARALSDASSSTDVSRINQASHQLAEWETESGFHSLLQNASASPDLPYEARLMALLQLRKGVAKYWRKLSKNALNDEEKSSIRKNLIANTLNVANPKLLDINAEITASVAVADLPNGWPELIPSLPGLLESPQRAQALAILSTLLENLWKRRTPQAQRVLVGNSDAILARICYLYTEYASEWYQQLSGASGPTSLPIERDDPMRLSFVTLLAARRLIFLGFTSPHEVHEIRAFWLRCAQDVTNYAQLFVRQNLNRGRTELLRSHLTEISKLQINMLRRSPGSFSTLPDSASMLQNQWSTAVDLRKKQCSASSISDENQQFLNRSSLQSLKLLRIAFQLAFDPIGSSPLRLNAAPSAMNQTRDMMKQEVFPQAKISGMIETLITEYLILIPDDMNRWREEPEQWELDHDRSETLFSDSVRGSAEELLRLIMRFHKNLGVKVLKNFKNLLSAPNENLIFMKEAVYAALTVCASILYDAFPFDDFFQQRLVPELQSRSQNGNIIRRRIAMMLAEWMPMGTHDVSKPLISDKTKSLAYECFQRLLDKSDPLNDEVVRITSAKQLKNVIKAFSFEPNLFKPFGPFILQSVTSLVNETELVEHKMSILDTLTSIIEHMDTEVRDFADGIVACLAPMWDVSAEEDLLKARLVTALKQLVLSGKTHSPQQVRTCGPVVELGIRQHADKNYYLLEDSLDLFAALLQFTPRPAPPDYLKLAPSLLPILQLDIDHVEKTLPLLESLVLVGHDTLLTDNFRPQIFAALAPVFSFRKPLVLDSLAKLLETILRAAHGLDAQNGVRAVATELVECGILSDAFDSLSKSWARKFYRENTSRDPRHDEEQSRTRAAADEDGHSSKEHETLQTRLLSRIIVLEPQAFFAALKAWLAQTTLTGAAAPIGDDAETLSRLLAAWFDRLDYITYLTEQKLTGLALARLLEFAEPWILPHLSMIINYWTSLVLQLRDWNEDEQVMISEDLLVWDRINMPIGVGNDLKHFSSLNEERRGIVEWEDPVHTVVLTKHIREVLLTVFVKVGGEARFAELWIAGGKVDEGIVKAWNELGIVRLGAY